ncbi:hypothetical protein ACH5RR_023912 [Cinchona calisaya]|uniref:3-beta hydroxysteroid dehydrogenase/isomerase domain-containing protein n=1 Tax=Cinchona calisaya TaxID=153742 RepID=A0ABD2ZC05_9GENT
MPQLGPLQIKRRTLTTSQNYPVHQKTNIFEADLDEPDSFDAAIQGCTGVFHVAYLIDLEGKEAEETKIKRAVNGTVGMLQACLNSKTMKRIVYTSSTSTVVYNDKGLNIFDESIWCDIDCIRRISGYSGIASYAISKTLTERLP